MTSAPDSDFVLATIEAMRWQEETGYKAHNYLYQQMPETPSMNGPQDVFSPESAPVDVECRFRMSEWCYQIVDFCKFRRDSVAIAMSCLDRFLCSPAGREIFLDRSKFQLAAMTALYSTVKIHEPEAMDPNLIASLSRGVFNTDQVEAMEVVMLNAVQWRMNPPTAIAFIHQFFDLIPSHLVSEESREAVIELAKFQTELVVSDADFIAVNPSSVALGALMNAFDSLAMETKLQSHILSVLSEATKVDSQSQSFTDVRIRLYEATTGQSESNLCSSLAPQEPGSGEYTKTISSSGYESPRSVSVVS
jgi:hypothetical protein